MLQILLAAKHVASLVMEQGITQSIDVLKVYQTTQSRLDNPRNLILESRKEVKNGQGDKL